MDCGNRCKILEKNACTSSCEESTLEEGVDFDEKALGVTCQEIKIKLEL